jgi:hypothetical protein
MSFKDMTDLHSMFFRGLQVNFDIALRIDHDRLALRRQHVGSMRQATQVKLFEVHDRRLSWEF